jgi:hypothetical protein
VNQYGPQRVPPLSASADSSHFKKAAVDRSRRPPGTIHSVGRDAVDGGLEGLT